MKKLIFFCSLICFGFPGIAQSSQKPITLKPSDTSSTFLFTAGYRMPVNKNIVLNSGQGFYFEGGINPGKLISKKIILGLYAGWAWRGSAWSTSFNTHFANDYKQALNHHDKNFSQLEKDIIQSSSQLFEEKKGRSLSMPGCETNSFQNYSVYYGLIFKLPYRYSPVIKIYSGSTRSYYMGNKIVTHNKDYNIFELRRKLFGSELIFFRGLQFKNHINAGALSLYIESCNLKSSRLYFNDGEITHDLAVKNFTSPLFLNKYKREVTIGFRLSFCIM